MPPASASAGKLGRIPAQHMVRSGRHDFCVACQRNAAVAASRVMPHEPYLREWIPRLVTAEPADVVITKRMHLAFDLSYIHMDGRWRTPGAWPGCTYPIRPPGISNVRMVLVGDSADAADDWIAEHVSSVDVCAI